MKKMYLMKGMAVLALGLVAVSCNKLDFSNQAQISEEEALQNAEMQLGVTIDPKQDWNMTQNVTTKVSLNMGTGKDYTVYVFNDSPFDSDDAVYYSMNTVSDGASMSQTITVPKGQEMLYISVFDSDGSSVSKRIFLSGDEVDVSFGDGTTRATRRAMRRGNNANGDEWADVTNSTGFGGWLVPDSLTEGQKERVKAYFQNNPGGTYVNPEWENFFIQQVYKGGTDPGENSTEVVVAADGSSEYSSDNMNELSVGRNHVDCGDFEKANASFYDNVLDNGSNLKTHNPQTYHKDQIELMVGIDDMSCFSYKGIAGKWHDDKAVLVDASVIDEWAEKQTTVPGAKVVDKWNRSFMGFDHDLLYEEDILVSGKYVTLGNMQNKGGRPEYVWDGQKVMKVGKKPSATVSNDIDLSSFVNPNGKNYYWNPTPKMENGVLVAYIEGWQPISTDEFAADWSGCTSLVISLEESTTAKVDVYLETYNNVYVAQTFESGLKTLTLDLTGKNVQAKKIFIKPQANTTLKITNIHVNGNVKPLGAGEDYYESDYILIDGDKKIQFFIENRDQYVGSKLTSDASIAVQANMWITTKDGKKCLNLPKFKEAYEAGYHPTDDNLNNWYRFDGSDNYYSDWIVTLCKAKRVGEEEINIVPPVITPAIYSYAFEDTKNGDYDMNDVVLKCQENEDGENIDVWLVAAGATLDLEINLYEYDETNVNGEHPYYGNFVRTLEYNGKTEIHDMWEIDRGTMVNTNAGANKAPIRIAQLPKSEGYEADKLRFTIKSVVWEVFLSGSGQAPYGVVIPFDWKWPTERTRITNAYNETNTTEAETDQSFAKFASQAGAAEKWYEYPTTKVMIKNFK